MTFEALFFFFFYILQNWFSLLQSEEAWHGILLMSSHLHLLSEQSGNYGNRQGQHSSLEFECRQMQSLWSRKCCKAELSLSAWPCSNHSAHSNLYFITTRCIEYIHYCTFLCTFSFIHAFCFCWKLETFTTLTWVEAHTSPPLQYLSLAYSDQLPDSLVQAKLSFNPLYIITSSPLHLIRPFPPAASPCPNPLVCVSQSPLVLCVHGQHM